MESTIKDYSAGEVIEEPTFSASLLKGLDSVMQYTVTDENGKESHASYKPSDLGKAGEEALLHHGSRKTAASGVAHEG